MLVFYHSNGIDDNKHMLFYYCCMSIFMFFHAILCSLSLLCMLSPELQSHRKNDTALVQELLFS